MKILIACEQSGIVREAFAKRGHDAWSCDLLPTEIPGQHYQGYLEDFIGSGKDWDMIIAFPPCTHLAVSGARWFKDKKEEQEQAIFFFMMIANRDCPRIAIENPVGIMSTQWRKPDQIIQPWMFGDPFQKTTCLWLKGLPKLQSTDIVDKGEMYVAKSGKTMPKWYADAFRLSADERSKLRSRTFQGIADAIAEQWGEE
jgi:site-specific DNA-cytosine methylase